MNILKTIVTAIAAFGMSGAWAEYIWTGQSNNIYENGFNWNHNGATVQPGTSPTENVTIAVAGAEVVYDSGFDLQPQAGTVFAISNGASMVQTTGNWPQIFGTLLLDNGTADFSVPGETRIASGGAIVIQNGGKLICQSVTGAGTLTLNKGAKWTTTGEYKPVDGTVLEDVEISCVTIVPVSQATVTVKSGRFVTSRTDAAGYYQNGGSCFDVQSTGAFYYTFVKTSNTVYAETFGSSKFKYDGESLTADQFASTFDVTDNGDGTVTISHTPASADAAEFASAAVVPSADDGAVSVSASFTTTGDPAATVYFVWSAEADKGRKLADWGENTKEVGTASTSEALTATVSGLPERMRLYCRLIAVSDDASSASECLPVYTRDYGVDGTVDEWLGTAGNWAEADNWSLGRVPLDTDIIWIDKSDAVVTKTSSYKVKSTDQLLQGTLNLTGKAELQIDHDVMLSSFNVSCYTIVMSGNPVLTLKGCSVTARRTSSTSDAKAGVYPQGATEGRVNFMSSNKAASYTYIQVAEDPYNDTFFGGKFLLNGVVIENSTFASSFTVSTAADPDDASKTDVTITLPASVAAPAITAQTAEYADEKATFTARLDGDSPDDTTVTLCYDTSDHERGTDFGWPNTASLTKQEDGTFAVTLDLAKGYRYYYNLKAYSAGSNLSDWKYGNVVVADLPTDSNVWLGKTSDLTSSSNWSKGTVPGASDIVELNGLFSSGSSLSWSCAAISTVAGWRQSASIAVSFDTTKDSPFTVAGDVALEAGSWTHAGPALAPSACLNVRVTGDLTVASGAKITAARKGYYKGPGVAVQVGTKEDTEASVTRVLWTGGSYAGDAGHPAFDAATALADGFVSYGSILDPLEWGSAGKGDQVVVDSVGYYAGSGLVILSVDGALTVNGTIDANGFGYNLDDFSGASGGTVNITAGTVSGSGKISANGGNCNCGPGGGGRIRVELTAAGASFGDFDAPDHIVANSGTLELTDTQTTFRDTSTGAAGTIALVAGGVTNIVVADTCSTYRAATAEGDFVAATHIPSRQNASENLRASNWSLSGNGKLRLTANAKISSLVIADKENEKVFLDGHSFSTEHLIVANNAIKPGIYNAETLNAKIGNGISVFVGEGSVVVGRPSCIVIFN